MAQVPFAWSITVGRRRNRLNWVWNDELQEFNTGSLHPVSIWEVAELRYNQIIAHHDFQGPWMGWRMRGAMLIPPGGSYRSLHIKAHAASAFMRQLLENERLETLDIQRRQAVKQFAEEGGLRLVYSRG